MRPAPSPLPRPGPGIASTNSLPSHPASNLAQTYRQGLPPRTNGGPSQGMGPGSYRGAPPPNQGQPQQQQYGGPGPGQGQGQPGYDPRRGPPPPQQAQGPARNGMRAPPAGAGGRRF